MPTYRITLWLSGSDNPVAIYRGVKEYHAQVDGSRLTFTRESGQVEETNLHWEALREE